MIKKKRHVYKQIVLLLVAFILVGLCGCSETKDLYNDSQKNMNSEELSKAQDIAIEKSVDWRNHFNGINGCAVVFVPSENTYYFYNKEMCKIEISPCSTFKIVSTLIGLSNSVIKSEESIMDYNGENYPISAWNGDLTLEEAFQTSCVWYFRQVIDKVGENEVKKELERLDYGNCDTSEWNGSNINPSQDLNGFWLESSLKISPLQQTNILARIFEERTDYSSENIDILKKIMKIDMDDNMNLYGKTGTGIDGHTWFVGFVENDIQRKYFAVYLSDNTVDGLSGYKAKEIAISILASGK
ncbi:penicillin-binding transpeptidase domain-containing protein [uncultured Clostridium sp.]|uniref:penicillin-binding transpeptidase domain-containing protein n=1 Tax=uncultured Clostridium sp. TaxID=59620 RepID=UPI0028ED8430|nr:penicillin-binding transpeptidase domain-containing protein [uncultured Clostridium sp.]